MLAVRTLSISIHRAPADVYLFVHNGANLPAWAHGVGTSVKPDGDAFVADGPLGRATIRFAPANQLGVLDHDVTLPNGTTVHNPMRVMPNGAGSTVSFTLFQLVGVTTEQLEKDAQMVEADLQRLKQVLEA
jgi:hypothetical protein